MDPAPGDLVLVGRVGRPHGVRGELKVVPITDDPDRLLGIEQLFIGADAEQAGPFEVQGSRMQRGKRGPVVLVHLKDRATREDAALLQGLLVYVCEDDLPLDEDEFFLHDLVGLAVRRADDDAAIGTVREVLSMPAQDLLVIARPEGPDALVPLVDEFLEEIDLEAGWIRIRLIDGLLEG